MKRNSITVLSALVTAAASTATFAALNPVSINVTTALAPNAFGSPSYATYVSNTEYALQNGLTSYGSGPSAYSAVTSPVSRSSVIVTGFYSWLGATNPGAVYGAAYAKELGNRMSFPLDVKGNGTKISISELSFTGTSTGDLNGLGFNFAEGTYNYGGSTGSDYIGINYGADGIKGTADDVIVNSGANTQLVDEIVGRGSGNSYDAYSDPANVLTDQQELDLAANSPTQQWDTFTGSYSLDLGSGNSVGASATFNAVPEPTDIALIGLAAGSLLFRRRR